MDIHTGQSCPLSCQPPFGLLFSGCAVRWVPLLWAVGPWALSICDDSCDVTAFLPGPFQSGKGVWEGGGFLPPPPPPRPPVISSREVDPVKSSRHTLVTIPPSSASASLFFFPLAPPSFPVLTSFPSPFVLQVEASSYTERNSGVG